VVLYEMLTGRRAFEGATHTDIAAAVLAKDPPPLTGGAPPVLAQLVLRCLEKRSEDRFSSARDLAFALEAVSGSGAAVSAPTTGPRVVISRSRLWIGVAAVVVLLVAGGIFITLYNSRGNKSAPKPFEHVKVTRLTHGGTAQLWQGFAFSRAALSPDGRYVAYFRNDDRGRAGLWLQNLATSSAVQILPASEDRPVDPVYSPDGNYVYYLVCPKGLLSQLYRVPVLGGAPEPMPIQDIDTPVTFSPDGKQVAFVRGVQGL
jgi:serine/threonine protein kinase